MYSYEDRVRAVQLYIKYGRSAAATIRELGYPSRKNLARWYRAFVEVGDLPAGYRRSRPRYSTEQKQIAVEHYWSHGCNFAGTTRALGYPCRAVLAAWVYELCPDIRKRLVSNARNVPSSPVLRQAAVIELCTRDEGARVIAEKIGVSRPTLYNWKNKLLGREAPASMKRHKNPASAPERAELEQQLESLRRDIRQLQLEHDILKKANELLKKGSSRITGERGADLEEEVFLVAIPIGPTLDDLDSVVDAFDDAGIERMSAAGEDAVPVTL